MKKVIPLRNFPNYHKRQLGFTLLEILVAIVVLSFGLLGMVGIQAMALKSNNDAKQQSAAIQFAGELSDMMRGNKQVAIQITAAANPYLTPNFIGAGDGTTGIPTPTEKCSGTIGCTSTLNVAQWEIADWLTRIDRTFPGARVQVCYHDTPYTGGGMPQWGCTPATAASVGQPLYIKIGWTRESTNKTRVDTGNTIADAATNAAAAFNVATGANAAPPLIVYAVTPGSSE